MVLIFVSRQVWLDFPEIAKFQQEVDGKCVPLWDSLQRQQAEKPNSTKLETSIGSNVSRKRKRLDRDAECSMNESKVEINRDISAEKSIQFPKLEAPSEKQCTGVFGMEFFTTDLAASLSFWQTILDSQVVKWIGKDSGRLSS